MYKKTISKQFLALALTGLMLTTSIPVAATEVTSDEKPKNPVYSDEGVTWTEGSYWETGYMGEKKDHTEWSYVYFGSYPQTEVTDSAVKAMIDSALADDGKTTGDVTVGSNKYRKVQPGNANNSESWNEDGSVPKADEYRYFKWEPIRWKVLQVDEEKNTLFVFSEKALDCQEFNEEYESVLWENSTIRKWLNGSQDYESDPVRSGFTKNETFFNTAFSDVKEAVLEVEIENKANPWYDSPAGNPTRDSVFLLSIDEVTQKAYGFRERFDQHSTSRIVEPTDYAHAMGVFQESETEQLRGEIYWWLRSPGSSGYDVMRCGNSGWRFKFGNAGNNTVTGVVPALYLNLESQLWSVNEDGSHHYIIIFDGNGATVEDNVKETEGDGSLTFPIVSREGYTFKGWFTQKEGGEQVTENTVFTKDMTVYAQWTKNESPSNGGEGGGTGTGTETETQKPGTEGGQQAPGKDPAQTEVATPGQVTLGSVKNNKKATVTIKIKTKKTDPKVDGYEVASATSKKKLSKVKKYKTFTKTSFKLTKMKKGKTYYIKVRAFNKGADGKIVYGEWSKVKKIKVKK